MLKSRMGGLIKCMGSMEGLVVLPSHVVSPEESLNEP